MIWVPGIVDGPQSVSVRTESMRWVTGSQHAKGVWCYRGFASTGPPRYRYIRLPDGLATLVVDLDKDVDRVRHAFVLAGLCMRPRETACFALARGLCIYLAPWAVFALLNGDVRWTTGAPVELMDGTIPALDRLVNALRIAGTWAQVFTIVDGFVTEALVARHARSRQRAYSNEVARAWHVLSGVGGRLTVKELAARVNLGERHLETRFREQVGLTPKQCAQVFRFRRACGLLAKGLPQADVTIACGYHDKAHLCHEFRAMSGLTPGRFSRAPHDSFDVPT